MSERRKGRPTRRWTEDIKKWLHMSLTEAGSEAQKREVFRRMVREATSTQTCQDESGERMAEKSIVDEVLSKLTGSAQNDENLKDFLGKLTKNGVPVLREIIKITQAHLWKN